MNLVLDNEDATYDDYVKHTPAVSVVHSFSLHWQAQVDYFFTKGDFDQDDDLENHAGHLYIFYHPSANSKIYGHGGYTVNSYEGLQEDYAFSKISLGFERQTSSIAHFKLEAGGIFLSRDELEGKDSFYCLVSIIEKLQHGALTFAGEGGIDEQQFDGASVGDLSRYWQIKMDFNYELAEKLLSSVNCIFREDRYWELSPEKKEEKLQAEAALSYTFGRWYTASVRYAYSRKVSDISSRCYDDNRLFLEVGFSNDFFRW